MLPPHRPPQYLEYLNRYYDKKALSYVETAKLWLRSEYQQRNWDRELQNLLNKIEKIKYWSYSSFYEEDRFSGTFEEAVQETEILKIGRAHV